MPRRKKASQTAKGYPRSPTKESRAKKALFEVETNSLSISKAAQKYDLTYSYIQRRVSGKISVNARNGPSPVLLIDEERVIAKYVSEMAMRGMGLRPTDVLDLVQNLLQREKRKNPFTNNRPGYTWYYGFVNRHHLEMRKETPLEQSRAKVTPARLDKWFEGYRAFVSNLELLDKPNRIWNADETGFAMGSKAGNVVGPSKAAHPGPIPHLAGGSTKQRLTVMYCANAEGTLMPPMFVYPEPKPTAFDPLIGATRGAEIQYSGKGWMNTEIFSKFIDHFDKHAGQERPVILLIDSVSSHINMDIFTKAKERGIELYRLVPNATHIMQPLDKGVFGLLKKEWSNTVRKNTRENPGQPIGKKQFAGKLQETQLEFYTPGKIIGSFRGSGIYPVNRMAISNDILKPSSTFVNDEDDEAQVTTKSVCTESQPSNSASGAAEAFRVYNEVLDTPKRNKYQERVEEGYDVENGSPGFLVYKKLRSRMAIEEEAGDTINIVAEEIEIATTSKSSTMTPVHNKESTDDNISPTLRELTTLPKCTAATKDKPPRLLDIMPDNLTSPESIRMCAVAQLRPAQEKAEKEKVAKARYHTKIACQQKDPKKRKNESNAIPKKNKSKRLSFDETICPCCHGSFEEEQRDGIDMVWVECDRCDKWMHTDCIPVNHAFHEDSDFICHICDN